MNFATICQVALAKVLMKGHDILASFTTFAINVQERTDGTWVVQFSATDGGYERLYIDVASFATEDEAYAWLANGRLSTRALNKAVSEYDLYVEEAELLSEEMIIAGEEDGLRSDQEALGVLVNGVHPLRRDWDWDIIEARSPFFEDFLLNNFEDGEYPRLNTRAEIKRLRTLLAKRPR